MVTPLPETAVLKRRDPALDLDTDAWPEFNLRDVEVFASIEACNRLEGWTSLLHASEHNPLTLTGKLSAPTSATRSLYLDAGRIPKHGQPIVIEAVRSFAYGQYGDGTVALWAAGKAGWFALKSSRRYKAMFNEMGHAVETLYWLADHYEQSEAHDPPLEELYRELGRLGSKERSAPAATEEELMVMSGDVFEARGEGRVWMHREFLLSSMLGKKEGVKWHKKLLFKHLCQEYPDELAAVKERFFGKPKKGGRQPQLRQGSVDSMGSLKRKRERPSKAGSVITIESSSAGRQTHVESVKKPKLSMPPPPARGSRQTRGSRASSRLSATSQAPEDSEAEPAWTTTPPQEDSEEDELIHAQKRKSALRLKPSKASKGTNRSGKAPTEEFDDNGEEEENEVDQPAEASPTLPAAKRRQTSPSAPHRSTSASSDEGIDMPSSPSSSNSHPTTQHKSTSPNPISANDPTPQNPDSSIHPANDPVQENTYTCPLAGCNHKVYLASEPQSQKLIREHFALHAYDDDMRVQLVKKLALPGMGSGYLMRKVQEKVAREGFVGSFEGEGDVGGGAEVEAAGRADGEGVRSMY